MSRTTSKRFVPRRASHEIQTDGLLRYWPAYLGSSTNGSQILLIPAPVMAEYLVGFPDEAQRNQQAELLSSVFFVAPLDAKVAQMVAELSIDRDLIKAVRNEHNLTKNQVSVDLQILGIAAANSVEAVVAHDEQFPKLAQDKVNVIYVPTIAEQLELL